MPLNEYGEKLDSNGYAPSILHDKPVCLICGMAQHGMRCTSGAPTEQRASVWACG